MDCVCFPDFENLYTRFLIQKDLGFGRIFKALGEVHRVSVVGRRHHDTNFTSDLGDGIEVVCDDGNPADPDAVAVHRDKKLIGYVPRDRTSVVRQWLREAAHGKKVFIASTKAIYVIPGNALPV